MRLLRNAAVLLLIALAAAACGGGGGDGGGSTRNLHDAGLQDGSSDPDPNCADPELCRQDGPAPRHDSAAPPANVRLALAQAASAAPHEAPARFARGENAAPVVRAADAARLPPTARHGAWACRGEP